MCCTQCADMPGQPRRLCRGALDCLPVDDATAPRRAAFVAAAETAWAALLATPACKAAGEGMLANMRTNPIQVSTLENALLRTPAVGASAHKNVYQSTLVCSHLNIVRAKVRRMV